MKKFELIKILKEAGLDTNGKKWHELLEMKKQLDNKDDEIGFEADTLSEEIIEEEIIEEEIIEEEIKIYSDEELNKLPVNEMRSIVVPQIRDFVNTFSGQMSIQREEINEMLRLHNLYYRRNDSASCGSCVGRYFHGLKKLI